MFQVKLKLHMKVLFLLIFKKKKRERKKTNNNLVCLLRCLWRIFEGFWRLKPSLSFLSAWPQLHMC